MKTVFGFKSAVFTGFSLLAVIGSISPASAARDRDVKRLAETIQDVRWDSACRVRVDAVKRKEGRNHFDLIVSSFSDSRTEVLFPDCDSEGDETHCVRSEEIDRDGKFKSCKLERLVFDKNEPRLRYQTIVLSKVKDKKDCTENYFERKADASDVRTHMDSADSRRCGR